MIRHGLRLDAADQSWHLHTPTPYDPPLTYGGWNQCRALGARIATLLNAREQEAAAPEPDSSVKSHDFASRHARDGGAQGDGHGDERPRKRRRIKHNVVIHSSPFLRCLQTSVAIAAGMAQYKPSIEAVGRTRGTSKSQGASPQLRPMERHASPRLAPIVEPNLAHTVARKVLQQPRHHRKSTLRVDAFLGEWLNPEYYESILPPPPSAMMVTTAKAELMENEAVELFTPAASAKSSSGSLWNANGNATSSGSRESPLDDWSPVDEAMPTSPVSPSSRRRASQSSVGSIDRPKSPFRPGSALQPLTSTLPKQESAVYHPPQPHYAVSSSDHIPRGYVAHARTACVNVEYQWDSSRSPQNWGDGGEFGEEWSSMHKRFRRGLNHLIGWYSCESTDDRSEDALGVDQADRRPQSKHVEEEEQEDTVVIMVTHGAGCNALIGALTGQPVLLDVGMASLTMAVRRDDAPPITTYASTTGPISPPPDGSLDPSPIRRTSLDLGLSSIYEMKLVASSEHLRPSASSMSPSMRPVDFNRKAFVEKYTRERYFTHNEPARSNTNSALGSIRRPSAVNALPSVPGVPDRSTSLPPGERPMSTGLWTPPSGAMTPDPGPQQTSYLAEPARPGLFTANSGPAALPPVPSGLHNALDASTSPTSDPSTKHELPIEDESVAESSSVKPDELHALPSPDDSVPSNLSRGLSQKGLWGANPSGARVERKGRDGAKLPPKRRWTVDQE